MSQGIFIMLAALALTVGAPRPSSLAQEPAAKSQQIAAPDYNGGGFWNYRVVHKMLAGGYRSDLISGDFEITMQGGRRNIVQVGGGNALASEDGYRIQAMVVGPIDKEVAPYFSFPLWVGKQWTGNQLTLPDRKWRLVHHSVTGTETVATPAGNFSAYRIERSAILAVRAINYYDNEVYFYSAETQSVIKYEYHRTMKDLVGDPVYSEMEAIRIDLTGFKPKG
jgi:hypothetical protein